LIYTIIVYIKMTSISKIDNDIEKLEKQKKLITIMLNQLKLERDLIKNKEKYNKMREIIFFTDNEEYTKLFEANLMDYNKEKRTVYFMKVCSGSDEYNMYVDYIYQPIRKLLEYFNKHKLYYYSSTKIENILELDIPVLQSTTSINNFCRYIEEKGEKILSFYDNSNDIDQVVYVYMYSMEIDVYVNNDNEMKEKIYYVDANDDSERIPYEYPTNDSDNDSDQVIQESPYIDGRYIDIIVWMDDETKYVKPSRECHG